MIASPWAPRWWSRTNVAALLLAAAVTTGAACVDRAPGAEVSGVVARERSEKTAFTDSEILEGFFRTAFGAEYHLAGRVDRIRKYDKPVRVMADGVNRRDRKAQLAKVVADIA